MFFDQAPRLGEVVLQGGPRVARQSVLAQSKQPRPMQMNVRYEQWHRPALGNFKGFVEVALRALRPNGHADEET